MNHDFFNSSFVRCAGCAGVVLIAACASSAPSEQLVDARRVYSEAQSSEAARLTPDELLSARQALERAEQEHKADPGSPEEAHLGYVASRRASMAIASGKIAAAKEHELDAEARYESSLEAQASQNQAQLQHTKGDLAKEQAARKDAERRAAAAIASLEQVAKVTEESRGKVITLPGGVLFPSGGSEISPAAQVALDKVADALGVQPGDAGVVVEGHTDSRGGEEKNQELSQQRAEAVRDYLVTKGVESGQIEAVGKGEAAPIADNESSEGRATNRRVEIVIAPRPPMDPAMSMTTPGQP